MRKHLAIALLAAAFSLAFTGQIGTSQSQLGNIVFGSSGAQLGGPTQPNGMLGIGAW